SAAGGARLSKRGVEADDGGAGPREARDETGENGAVPGAGTQSGFGRLVANDDDRRRAHGLVRPKPSIVDGPLEGGRRSAPGGRGGREVGQNPIVVCGDLAGGAAIVELLEKDRRRLAEGLSLRDEDGHRLGTAALTEQGGADRVIVTVSRQLRKFTPQRAPIVSKRLLDSSTLSGRTPALAERGLPELAERR